MLRTLLISLLIIHGAFGGDIRELFKIIEEGIEELKNETDNNFRSFNNDVIKRTEQFTSDVKVAVQNANKQLEEGSRQFLSGLNDTVQSFNVKIKEIIEKAGDFTIDTANMIRMFVENTTIFVTGSDWRIKTLEDYAKYGINYSNIPKGVLEDTFLTTPELIQKYGYPSEIHTVQTTDGYILEIHRIPKPGGLPVYLQHGLMDSSGLWVIMGPERAFAYMLHNMGYDVWIGNARGNRYSRKHISLKTTDKQFWNFSFHEIGLFDIPDTIDYILEKTGYDELHYIGHSQGTTAFWVMCSEKPQYCKKILSMHALAPVAYLSRQKSALLSNLAFLLLFDDNPGRWHTEVMQNDNLLRLGGQLMCSEEAFSQEVCMNIVFLLTGYNSEQVNKTMLPAILGHLPAGASAKQIIHYSQLVSGSRFKFFDYMATNKEYYNLSGPPEYKLENVIAPVALYYSKNDWLAAPDDVKKLEKELPNVIKEYLVPDEKFNHLDFLIAMNSRDMVQEEVVRVMKEIEEQKYKLTDF